MKQPNVANKILYAVRAGSAAMLAPATDAPSSTTRKKKTVFVRRRKEKRKEERKNDKNVDE